MELVVSLTSEALFTFAITKGQLSFSCYPNVF